MPLDELCLKFNKAGKRVLWLWKQFAFHVACAIESACLEAAGDDDSAGESGAAHVTEGADAEEPDDDAFNEAEALRGLGDLLSSAKSREHKAHAAKARGALAMYFHIPYILKHILVNF